MKNFKKILVPTDFSQGASTAYTHSEEIAKHFGATIDFIHVIPTLKYFNESISNLGLPFDMDNDLYPHVQKETTHKLKRAMNDYIKDEHKGQAIVRIDRKPSEVISEVAKEGGYDLIVMASHGEHETDLLRGSITEKVIRYSEIPVFTMDKRLSSDGLKRILFPTDTSSVSFTAFPLALSLADVYGAGITFFHVLELHGGISEDLPRDPDKSEKENIYEAIIEQLQEYLSSDDGNEANVNRSGKNYEDKLVINSTDSFTKTIPLHTVIKKAVSAHGGIEDYAPDNSDVVVMTTHGHSGLAHFFLGSTTEKVAQHIDVPVLTVKPPKEKLS